LIFVFHFFFFFFFPMADTTGQNRKGGETVRYAPSRIVSVASLPGQLSLKRRAPAVAPKINVAEAAAAAEGGPKRAKAADGAAVVMPAAPAMRERSGSPPPPSLDPHADSDDSSASAQGGDGLRGTCGGACNALCLFYFVVVCTMRTESSKIIKTIFFF
jgi:hypothetical protein